MELVKQPQTEQEYWEVIESLGGMLFYLNHDLADGRISDTNGGVAQELHNGQILIERLVQEACDKFGIVQKKDYPAGYRSGQELPPPPEGKRIYYWDWYYNMKRTWLVGEYNKLICSACPLSEGVEEFVSIGGRRIPCSVWHGFLYSLRRPDLCAMSDGHRSDWSREKLLSEILLKGGDEAVEAFLNKEKQLGEVAHAAG